MKPPFFCATCVFFSPSLHQRGSGQCRRHAPQLDQTEGRPRTLWPLTRDNNWCGEHMTIEEGA